MKLMTNDAAATTKSILRAITVAVRAAASAQLHKGDIQDAVWAVVFAQPRLVLR